jgi:hypothetical protein
VVGEVLVPWLQALLWWIDVNNEDWEDGQVCKARVGGPFKREYVRKVSLNGEDSVTV